MIGVIRGMLGVQAISHMCPGNRLCELLPADEAPEEVPDVDIFPLQPQLPQPGEAGVKGLGFRA